MFNIFKFYDEMLGMLHQDSREEVDTAWVTKEIPVDLEAEFDILVDNWLTSKGYDPRMFDIEENDDASS